jgi:hypothetical protein
MLSRSLGTHAHAEFVLDIASMDDGVRRVNEFIILKFMLIRRLGVRPQHEWSSNQSFCTRQEWRHLESSTEEALIAEGRSTIVADHSGGSSSFPMYSSLKLPCVGCMKTLLLSTD